MAATRTATTMILKEIVYCRLRLSFSSLSSSSLPSLRLTPTNLHANAVKFTRRELSFSRIRCAASDDKKVSARLSQVQQLLQEAEEQAISAGNEPPPKITLDHVTVSFARSGGPGGQNVNKVNTKVDMRFNVKDAYWLSDRIRDRIMQMEKNRINKDGEIVISSTKTRTQKGNIEDALAKLQAIIDAASYVPPPPSEEQKKKIAKLAAIGEQKRLKSKKVLSDKKAFRRSRISWD
ncbi:peptidyl-tRNA hydrolase ICT1, mitochondrial isoform X2 [Ricinus communis]|uniref:Immature colon carcinoma transcript, putative n=1 Tax=Ricinus communis TaxID=3988 RepID=B9RBS9_RICCO|nr:peptidyl-tRNA hydrolase ICT1, mitochondrial isoform X2 [Ricinus communis]EEF51000.1 immature colon carcinoma transcript, putative [Ricinus communis]|eukprot:XP_002509613.1 peptidyl-tRNA hydrolase ICT1, mitochondrial isoform X2 [Ricinus communis]